MTTACDIESCHSLGRPIWNLVQESIRRRRAAHPERASTKVGRQQTGHYPSATHDTDCRATSSLRPADLPKRSTSLVLLMFRETLVSPRQLLEHGLRVILASGLAAQQLS